MNSTIRTVLQIVLAVAIIGLGYYLYRTIVDPYKAYQAEQAEIAAIRARMNNVRQALSFYQRREEAYPSTLDSLVYYLETDSAALAVRDSIFDVQEGAEFDIDIDSLPYSPRTGERFNYALNDTSDVDNYWLQAPTRPADSIGTRTAEPALRNVASWE